MSGVSVQAIFPEGVEATTGPNAAQGQHVFGSRSAPKHAGLLEPGTDHSFAASFNHAGANEQVLFAEFGIAHAIPVAVEVFGLNEDGLNQLSVGVRVRQLLTSFRWPGSTAKSK